MRRADLHSVRPTISLRDAPPGMAKMAGDGRFPGSRVIAGTTFPGEWPSGFRCRLSVHSCGGSSGFAQTRAPSRFCRARDSLLVQSEDKTPSAVDSIRRKRPQVNPSGEDAGGMLPRECWYGPVAAHGIMPQDTMSEIDTDEAARHRAKMVKRKQVQDAEEASKTIAKGLLMVNTGPGKGKSTAAFGLALRALGHGWRGGVGEFIKGRVTGG